MTDPRIHHYIPQAYLRGFGWKRGEKNWHVNTWDLPGQRRFRPNTKNICCERDFLKFDNGEDSPYKLEAEMGKFENLVRQAILRVADTKTFAGEDRTYILSLVALLAVRSPQMREHMRETEERLLKMMLDVTLEKKERWDATVHKMRKKGLPIRNDVTYEQIKDLQKKDPFKLDLPRERQIVSELKMFESVLKYVGLRKWKLYVLRKGEGSFVTTDHPVSLTWCEPNAVPPFMRHSPGFGMKSTELIFPLTHTCLLHGRFDFEADAVEKAGEPLAAACNSRMIASCYKYAFSVDERIPYLIPPNSRYFDDQVLVRLKKYADTKSKADEPNEQSWSVRSGRPMPTMIDAPAKEEEDWNYPKFDVLFEDLRRS